MRIRSRIDMAIIVLATLACSSAVQAFCFTGDKQARRGALFQPDRTPAGGVMPRYYQGIPVNLLMHRAWLVEDLPEPPDPPDLRAAPVGKWESW